MEQKKAPRWPGGFPPGTARKKKLDGDFYDIDYAYHTPGLPSFTVTLMVHKDSCPAGWTDLAWVDRVGPEFIKTHFTSSWERIMSDVSAGERRIALYSRVSAGEDVTK